MIKEIIAIDVLIMAAIIVNIIRIRKNVIEVKEEVEIKIVKKIKIEKKIEIKIRIKIKKKV